MENNVLTEEEKMITGRLYLPSASELKGMLAKAKQLVFQYNATSPGEQERQETILTELFGKTLPEGIHLEPPFYCDYGCYIEFGRWFYANHNCVILDGGGVKIGDEVLFGPNVSLFTAGHPINPEIRASGQEYALPIQIGNRVWLGGGVIVNPGISIGDNSIIGSGSVVTKDIPANVIALGNPCRVIRAIEPGMKEKYKPAEL